MNLNKTKKKKKMKNNKQEAPQTNGENIEQLFDELSIRLTKDQDIQKSLERWFNEVKKYNIVSMDNTHKRATVNIEFVDANGKIRAKQLNGIPLLTIVPIPYIPINSINISFNDEDGSGNKKKK